MQVRGVVVTATVLALVAGGCADLRIASRSAQFASLEVEARAETEPVRNRGDAADDAAIWIDTSDVRRSTVIATDKTDDGGLSVYELSGRELHHYPDGAPNNVDIRLGVDLGGSRHDLVVTSDRGAGAIRVYRVDQRTRGLVDLADDRLSVTFDPYGICLYAADDGRLFAFVTSDDDRGIVEQWELRAAHPEVVHGERVREFRLGSKAEGCVVDDDDATLYVAEEEVGIWSVDAAPDGSPSPTPVASVLPSEGSFLVADVEGMVIHDGGDGRRFLVASSQGSSDFAVLELGSGDYVGRFRITKGAIDGVDHTDGIALTSVPLGPEYPAGVFVAQDDTNPGANQNFKLASWQDVVEGLALGGG